MDINFDWSYWKEFENAFFNDKQYCTIASCRGSGKTFNGFQWILEELFAEPNSLGLWMDTTQNNIYDYVQNYLQKQILMPIWDRLRLERSGNSPRRLLLPNGSVLKFASAERPDLAEGFRYHYIILNEAGIILKKPNVWDNTLEPMTHPRDGRPNKTRLIATPKGRNKFHQLASIENEDWAHYHFSIYDCPLYSDEEAERIKHGKPVEVWRQEYMAEFVEDAGMVFRNYSQCIRDIPQIDKGVGGKSYVVGIDLAKHTDFTVICVIDKESKELVHFERFNQIDWTFQKERIINIWNNFNNPQIVLDSTGVGDPIYNELQSSGLYIDGFRFTNSSKMELIRTLSIAFDNKGLYINNNEVLLNELGVFEYDITPSGNLTYSAPQGMHDDCVIALALANYGLKNTVVASIAAIPF